MKTIDLNCDLGESYGAWRIGSDEALIPMITSANIACGWHAGDPLVMEKTIQLAVASGVAIGAHPGFPDKMGFGRRPMECSRSEIRAYIIYQVGALQAFCKINGGRLRYVKPHGALYNMAESREEIADVIAEAIASLDAALAMVALAGPGADKKQKLAVKYGVPIVLEAFPDRAYQADGTLLPRREAGAVIADPAVVARRAVQMAKDGTVTAVGGTCLPLNPQTLCIHGDTPESLSNAAEIRNALRKEGVVIQPFM